MNGMAWDIERKVPSIAEIVSYRIHSLNSILAIQAWMSYSNLQRRTTNRWGNNVLFSMLMA